MNVRHLKIIFHNNLPYFLYTSLSYFFLLIMFFKAVSWLQWAANTFMLKGSSSPQPCYFFSLINLLLFLIFTIPRVNYKRSSFRAHYTCCICLSWDFSTLLTFLSEIIFLLGEAKVFHRVSGFYQVGLTSISLVIADKNIPRLWQMLL